MQQKALSDSYNGSLLFFAGSNNLRGELFTETSMKLGDDVMIRRVSMIFLPEERCMISFLVLIKHSGKTKKNYQYLATMKTNQCKAQSLEVYFFPLQM